MVENACKMQGVAGYSRRRCRVLGVRQESDDKSRLTSAPSWASGRWRRDCKCRNALASRALLDEILPKGCPVAAFPHFGQPYADLSRLENELTETSPCFGQTSFTGRSEVVYSVKRKSHPGNFASNRACAAASVIVGRAILCVLRNKM